MPSASSLPADRSCSEGAAAPKSTRFETVARRAEATQTRHKPAFSVVEAFGETLAIRKQAILNASKKDAEAAWFPTQSRITRMSTPLPTGNLPPRIPYISVFPYVL